MRVCSSTQAPVFQRSENKLTASKTLKDKCEREQRKSSFFFNNVSFSLLQEKMEMTGTFKQQKFQLVDEGFNPSTITDPLYFLDNSKKAYVLLTKELHEMILSGKMRL